MLLFLRRRKRSPCLEALDIFGDSKELTEEYKMVEEIAFFSVEPKNKGVAKMRSSVEPHLTPQISELEKELARQVVATGEKQNEIINSEKNSYEYRFFPVLSSGEGNDYQWNSFVVGIKYNDWVMREEIFSHGSLFLINGLIMVIGFVFFVLVIVVLLRRFRQMTYYDHLTGLASRKLFQEKFNALIRTSGKYRRKIAVLFLDIDKFTEINNNFGHDTGDRVLQEISNRLKNMFPKGNIVSRLGGDEFTIALKDIVSREEAEKASKEIVEEFKKPLIINGKEYFISISVGLSIFPQDGTDLEELIKTADEDMYPAKN